MTASPLERATDDFASALAYWRVERRMTKRALAAEMGFDPSYVSHVEGRRHRPTQDFARRAEGVLRAGGAIWRHYVTYESLRQSAPDAAAISAPPAAGPSWMPPGTGLVVEREQAALGLSDGRYTIRVRRHLFNAGTDPVVRYPVRIRVDRDPAHPRRSAQLHHGAPLTWTELGFTAHTTDGEPLSWRASYESDTLKELWLLLESPERRFPLHPGERLAIEYGYQVGVDKWGWWFQRAVRLPTRELRVELDLPTADEPIVWGTVSSLSVEGAPLPTPITVTPDGDRTRFRWSVLDPLLQARYRFEWRLPS